MRKQLFTILAIIHFGIFGVNAQNPDGNNFNSYYTDQYANIVPPTPNAANFMQYGNTPVNASSGLPSISIPIFTIEEDGVQVPIYLSYNASGIKVDDISSTVGLKWVLNAGGTVSRTINDLDDLKTTFGWTSGGAISHFDYWLNNNANFDYDDYDEQVNFLSEFLSDYDNWPDDFNYNFLNYSGDFMFKPNGTIIKSMKDNLNIEGGLAGFFIEDKMGNSYDFDVVEKNNSLTRSYIEGEDNIDFQRDLQDVGWMLKTIETKNNKKINFEYIPYTYIYDIRPISQRLVSSFNCAPETCTFPLNCTGTGNDRLMNDKVHATGLFQTTYNQLIHKIYTEDVEVVFEYLENDIDENGNTKIIDGWKKRIDKIIIRDKIQGKEKKFYFKYDVYQGDARLKLTEVREVGFDGTEKPPYKFTYNETTIGLPSPGSLSKDYKGYFNGNTNNTSLLPKTAFTLENKRFVILDPNSPPVIIHPGYRLLSNRNFNIDVLSTGVLSQIEYPTGGKAKFLYEANAIGNNPNEPLIETSSFLMTNHFNEEREGPRYVYSQLIKMDNVVGQVRLHLDPNSVCPDCPCTDCPGNIETPLLIIQEYFGDIDDPIDPESVGNVVLRGQIKENSFSPNYVGFRSSTNTDNYIIKMKLGGTASNYDGPINYPMLLNLEWNKKAVDGSGNVVYQKNYFGGLRVKEIKDFDSDNKVYNRRVFDYISGVEGNYSDLMTSENIRTIANQDIFSTDRILLPGSQLISGYYYSEVEIRNQNGSNFSKTIEKYNGRRGFKSLTGGDLIERRIFNENNELLEVTQNNYLPETFDTLSFMTPSLMTHAYSKWLMCVTGGWITIPQAGYYQPDSSYQFEYKTLNRLLNSTMSTKFLQTGSIYKPLTVVRNYEYNFDLLIEQEKVDTRYGSTLDPITGVISYISNYNPNGEVIQTNYQYPRYLLPPINDIPEGLPISKEVFNTGEKILGQYFEYDNVGNIKNTYRFNKGGGTHSGGPTYVPSEYELDISYLTAQGKPTQVRGQDGVTTSYIWGYNKSYPVAKIIGLSHIQAVGTPNLNLGTINDPNTDEDVINEIKKIRQHFPDAQVTTYTYKPLIGISTITDPKGYKITYVYDGFGRLKYVKDMEGNVLSENQYHYKND